MDPFASIPVAEPDTAAPAEDPFATLSLEEPASEAPPEAPTDLLSPEQPEDKQIAITDPEGNDQGPEAQNGSDDLIN